MFRLSPDSSNPRQLTPEGQYAATLRFVDDMGEKTRSFDGNEKTYPQVRLTFMSDQVDAQGRPYRISQVYPFNLSKGSHLMRLLKNWMGASLDTFIEQRGTLEDLIGRPALITVKHQERDGTTYANIVDSAPLKDNQRSPDSN
jgi:hypothetical protein